MKIRIMKQFNKFLALFCIVALMMLFTTVNINSAYAMEPSARPRPTPEASPTPNPSPTPYKKERKHTDKELTDLKDKITEVFLLVEDATETITPGNANAKNRLKAAKSKLDLLSLDDLDALRDSIDPAELDESLADARGKLDKVKPSLNAAYGQLSNSWQKAGKTNSSDRFSMDSPLPGIEGPDAVCETLIGMGHAKAAVVIAANAAFVATKILNIALSRGCEQVIVAGVIVLGAGAVGGGNTSAACIISDGLLFAAEQFRDKVAGCDDDFTVRSVDAAVERLGTIHGDLENSVANDNLNKTAIVTNAAANTSTITAAVTSAKTFIDDNATTNKNTITRAINDGTTTVTTAVGDGTTTILVNDNKNKNTIVADAKTNREAVVANDNANKDTIIVNANANKVELIRLKIAADLASSDNSTLIGAFMLPALQGGYLELVRAIVVQAITGLAGSSTSQANSLLAQGDASEKAGDYKNAYASYRKAYKVAVK